jgi:histidine ammonia-lyase
MRPQSNAMNDPQSAIENRKSKILLDGDNLTIEEVAAAALAGPGDVAAELSPGARAKVVHSRTAVERFLAEGRVVYGITTGFGALKDKLIPLDQVRGLQRNIIMSHAVGVGSAFETPVVRAMMLIRANTLAKGYSGICPETLDLLLGMLTRGVHPIVPVQGSLGASGDLAPLAHIALVMIGMGEAEYEGEVIAGAEALYRAGLSPVELAAKEGLALTNGTALMAALGALAVMEAENAAAVADVAGAMSLEALHGTTWAFDPRLHAVRPHPRQVDCAAQMRRLVEGSTFVRPPDDLDVQDAYTLRCIPQVHGACHDAIKYARWVLEIELNSATDNPLIFWEGDVPVAISGGNFHGEPLAIAFDYLGLGMTELGNIAERRLTRLTDGTSNRHVLPDFLTREAGINSGFMLTQYTAAALASENKALVHPASSDTIPTSANWEDHVSNGPIAARQVRQIIQNVERILAIELLAAAQGIDFRREAMPAARLGRGTQIAYDMLRSRVPFLDRDDVMYPYMNAVHRLVASGELAREMVSRLEGFRCC